MGRWNVTLLLGAALLGSEAQTPQVPDWALPGSLTHKQTPPPDGFHRKTTTEFASLGVFEGQSDVGSAVVPGSSSYDPSTRQYTVRSAGYNIWYNRDEFRFVWKKMSGDISLAADASFPNPDGYDDRKAVLVLRQTLDDDSVEAVVGQHGGGLIHLAERTQTNAMMSDEQFRFGGMLARLKARRIGIEKRGDQIAIFIALKDEPLHQFGPPIHVNFTGPFYAGIGFCSHLPATVDSVVFSDVVLENEAGRVR